MQSAVLKHWHPVIGRDFHIPWPPGSPAPSPAPVPYTTCLFMMGTGLTAQFATVHVQQGLGFTMKVPTDVGPMIPHIGPPSQTLPIDIAFSASKSYFGPASTETQGQRIAAALAGHMNPNLDCGTPVPTPFGCVIAITTVYTSMSLADVMYGFNAMAIDFCIQSILNAIGNGLGNIAGRILGRFAPRVMSRAAAKALLRNRGGVPGNMINQAARDFARSQREAYYRYISRGVPARVGNIVNTVYGFLGGGPMGADGSTFGISTPGGTAGNAAQQYLNGGNVEQHGGSGMGGGGQTGNL